ncbi:MAG: hypothetical protein PHY47_00655 [Lachnospiraceae bacterium]|nr:hypothetical protein [Lachnospiraceae bacterium]
MADNEILIAGMDKIENPFSRFVNEYGFSIVHLPYNAPARDLPKCKAAIICTFNISHDLAWRVKEEYKKRDAPFIEAKQGSSSIADSFDKLIVQPIREKIEPLDVKERFLYLILYFNKIGSKVHSTTFASIVKHYTKFSEQYASVIFGQLRDAGILEKLTGTGSQGMYKVLGLSKSERSKLVTKIGESLPESWLSELIVFKEEVKRTETVVEQVKIPEVQPITKTQADELAEVKQQIKDLSQQVGAAVGQMRNQIDRLSRSFNPNDRQRMNEEVVERLNNLSMSEFLKVHAAIMMLTK